MKRLVVTRREVRLLIALAIVGAAVVGGSFGARAGSPTTLASVSDLAAQRASAERSIDKIYKTALEQLKTTRALKLSISDAQAAVIEQKYATQLKDLRRNALQALADAYSLSADQASAYTQQTESRLDTQNPASAPPVMLAPKLYQIVQRMAELGSQLSDAGIREMTIAPTGSPSPPGTARTSASPSPTR